MLLFKQIIIIFLIFYFGITIYVYLQQRNLIFFPNRTTHSLKESNSIEYTLEHSGARLNGWLLNHAVVPDKIIIYYGGNAEDIFYSRDQFKLYSDTATLLVNYRGYGSSNGMPGEQELFSDALAIYDDIVQRYAPNKIYLMGRSLGSAVACYVAANREATGVILVTPFDSLESIAKSRFPYLPVSLLLRHKFLSTDYAAEITSPTLIIYGGKDQTVKPENTQKLISALQGETKTVFIEEAEHNNIEMFDGYTLAILQFIQ